MPLHTQDPVGIASPLDTFDGPVGSTGSNLQIPARFLNRLMMRAVYDTMRSPRKRAKSASRLEGSGVSGVVFRFGLAIRHEVPLLMGRGGASFCLKVLNQRAPQINVQELAPIANGQDRLSFRKSVFENGTVGFLSSRVRGRGQPLIF